MQKKIVFLLHLQHLQATVVLKHSLYVDIENRFYYAKNILLRYQFRKFFLCFAMKAYLCTRQKGSLRARVRTRNFYFEFFPHFLIP